MNAPTEAQLEALLEAQRRGARRTALVFGAIALGFFIAAFIWLPR